MTMTINKLNNLLLELLTCFNEMGFKNFWPAEEYGFLKKFGESYVEILCVLKLK